MDVVYKKSRFGLRFRFILLSTLIFMVVFGGLTVLLVRNNSAVLRESLLTQTQVFSSLATEPIGETFVLYRNSGRVLIDKKVREIQELDSTIANVTVVDLDGTVEYSFNPSEDVTVSAEEASTFDTIYTYENGLVSQAIAPYFESNRSHRFTIIYTISNTELLNQINDEARTLIFSGLIAMSVTALGSYLFINRYIISPVKEVSTQAARISAGDLDQQVETTRHDEIGQLAHSVNKMAGSLMRSITELKEIDRVKSEFMMITSHNLRTPLAVMGGYLDGIDDNSDPEILKKSLKNLAAATQRLTVFAEDVLTISQMEFGETAVHKQPVELKTLLTTIADGYAQAAELKKITFLSEIPDFSISINIDRPQVRSAIQNILDNALKFTPEGGTVTMKLSTTASHAHISISDTGIGISQEEQKKLFTKFHRATSTEEYDYEGAGIGLYIAKLLITKQGGDITVVSEPGHGSTFNVILPL